MDLATRIASLVFVLALAACGGETGGAPAEGSAATCQDGSDNDSDGAIDCADTDCQGFVFCLAPSEDTATLCQNGEDDDGDSAADCADPDCAGFTFCAAPTETSAADCQDGADNDGDGDTDCDDADCSPFAFCRPPTEQTATVCQDGQDNDGDGRTDCADSDCQGFVFCNTGATENDALTCRDGQDNDGDGKIDCADAGCAGLTVCLPASETSVTACQDGVDNDRDGRTDCGDTDCLGYVFCFSTDETSALTCQDSTDNDGDGLTDCTDPDCQGYLFCRTDVEVSAGACQDSLDNDSDGLTDCNDPDCAGFVFCLTEESTSAACQDGADNDNDGDADCADRDCQGFVFCANAEVTPGECQDGVDNDTDGLVDCADTDCSGYTFCLSDESTSAACQDGVDNDIDGQVDCSDTDCQGYVFCAGSGTESTLVDCQDGTDNDGDGQVDCADRDCWHWGACRVYNGFPLVDSWGETWDGLERTATNWAAAEAVCTARGGRLPTATEIHRNNASSGTSDLSDSSETTYLWTRIMNTGGNYTAIRLSDGSVTYYAPTTSVNYRCVWPDRVGQGFDAARCHGDPTTPCFPFQRVWNVDGWDRAPLDWAAAVNECQFYDGSIPVPAEWGQMIHAGLGAGSDNWLWTGKATYWYSGGYGASIIKWTDSARDHWHYQNGNWGSLAWTTDTRPFRCVGLADPSAFAPPNPTCSGTCVALNDRRSPLVADGASRVATRFAVAIADCRADGGDLPTTIDFAELVHTYWPGGNGAWHWVTDPIYWYSGGYGYAMGQWTGDSVPTWSFNPSLGAVSAPASNRDYRCIWRTDGLFVPACQAGEVITWNGSAYACTAGSAGTSAGQANVIEIVDDWGNAWDGIQRAPADFATASTNCQSRGARLPRASELFAVRFTGNPHSPIDDNTSTTYLWTQTHTSAVGVRAQVRVSDGASTQAAESSLHSYRCIWPSTRGDLLGGRNCYGPPGAECFDTGDGVWSDAYDRVSLDAAGAINDCQASGGHLPDSRETTWLMHSGWPNGSGAWIWMDEPEYWYSGNYGYTLTQWTGTGLASWEYTPGGLSAPTSFRPFRCVYSTKLR